MKDPTSVFGGMVDFGRLDEDGVFDDITAIAQPQRVDILLKTSNDPPLDLTTRKRLDP